MRGIGHPSPFLALADPLSIRFWNCTAPMDSLILKTTIGRTTNAARSEGGPFPAW